MFGIPPRKRRPINGRAIAARRAAFQPKRAVFILPHPDRVPVKLLAAMQTPMLLFEVRPWAADAVLAEQVDLFIKG